MCNRYKNQIPQDRGRSREQRMGHIETSLADQQTRSNLANRRLSSTIKGKRTYQKK